jgi:hypothetical protein
MVMVRKNTVTTQGRKVSRTFRLVPEKIAAAQRVLGVRLDSSDTPDR